MMSGWIRMPCPRGAIGDGDQKSAVRVEDFQMAKAKHGDGQQDYPSEIAKSGKSIYDPLEGRDARLWIPTDVLERLLHEGMRGLCLAGLPLRTRSKVVKEHVCRALGYRVPTSFRKTQPRFPGQQLDTYVQKSNNLQVWNEEIDQTRRYAVIRVDTSDCIVAVRVIDGVALAALDTTGTLTQKFQARCVVGAEDAELITAEDTDNLRPLLMLGATTVGFKDPAAVPCLGELLPIKVLYQRLKGIIGQSVEDAGSDQERLRGAALHRLVCKTLRYRVYRDGGQFPDVSHQLLEVKLQTSPTIDLGMISPDSDAPLAMPRIERHQIRHCDVRYAICFGRTDGRKVTITHLILASGRDFFLRFPQFQGKVVNRKLQIPLPRGFFGVESEDSPDLTV